METECSDMKLKVISGEPQEVLKHCVRFVLGRHDPEWDFRKFEGRIHPETWKRHDELIRWSDTQAGLERAEEHAEQCKLSPDPLVRQDYALRMKVIEDFRDRFSTNRDLRFL